MSNGSIKATALGTSWQLNLDTDSGNEEFPAFESDEFIKLAHR